jgi:hypothetical protein
MAGFSFRPAFWQRERTRLVVCLNFGYFFNDATGAIFFSGQNGEV